jgi:sodium/bile acid cotransporter 7
MVYTVLDKNYFLISAFLMIIFCALYPDLGRNGGPLRTEYSVSYGANCMVFFISGLTLKSDALVKALGNSRLNGLIQMFIFVITPALFYALASSLRGTSLNKDLVDGIVMLGCLPTTINMCVVMTTSSGGSTAGALFNSTLSNILGIFVTPAYIFWLLGVTGDVEISDVFLALTYKVIIPTFVGQLVQNLPLDSVRYCIKAFKPHCKRTQESMLVLIVFGSFSTTFYEGVDVTAGDILSMLGLMGTMQVVVYAMTWNTFALKCLDMTLPDRICGMFCSTHKTLAMGIPLITSIYEGNASVGLFTIPLLIYHPSQIIFGSYMAPRFQAWMNAEKAAMGEVLGAAADAEMVRVKSDGVRPNRPDNDSSDKV